MKAKLLKSLRINGKSVAPKPGKVTLVDLSPEEFGRLAAMGAVVKPTVDDLKLAGADVATADQTSTQKGPKAPKGNAAGGAKNAATEEKAKADAGSNAGDDL